jgi:hypothetical protein
MEHPIKGSVFAKPALASARDEDQPYSSAGTAVLLLARSRSRRSYSRSPTASRASAWSQYSSMRIAFPSFKVKTIAYASLSGTPLA